MEQEEISPVARPSTETGYKNTMKIAVLKEPKNFIIERVDIPEPGEDEIRVRMEGCGICGSELPVWEGREWFDYPREAGSPGHEGYGIIDAVGSNVTDLKIGQRVGILSYHAYGEFDVAKAGNVVVLPDDFTGLPFTAEPLGCAINVFQRSDIQPGNTVAVIGAGFLGLLLIQMVKACGANVIAISRRKTALKMAFETGSNHIVEMDDHQRIIEKVNSITGGKGCDRVIEATGKSRPLDLAGELINTRGKLIIAGYHQDGERCINVQQWNWKGIDVINAHERDPLIYIKGMNDAVKAIQEKVLNPFPFYTHQFVLEDINSAFTLFQNREEGFLKGIIKFK